MQSLFNILSLGNQYSVSFRLNLLVFTSIVFVVRILFFALNTSYSVIFIDHKPFHHSSHYPAVMNYIRYSICFIQYWSPWKLKGCEFICIMIVLVLTYFFFLKSNIPRISSTVNEYLLSHGLYTSTGYIVFMPVAVSAIIALATYCTVHYFLSLSSNIHHSPRRRCLNETHFALNCLFKSLTKFGKHLVQIFPMSACAVKIKKELIVIIHYTL